MKNTLSSDVFVFFYRLFAITQLVLTQQAHYLQIYQIHHVHQLIHVKMEELVSRPIQKIFLYAIAPVAIQVSCKLNAGKHFKIIHFIIGYTCNSIIGVS